MPEGLMKEAVNESNNDERRKELRKQLPNVLELFANKGSTKGDVDSRSRLIDKFLADENDEHLDKLFDLGSTDPLNTNKKLMIWSLANTYSDIIYARYGSTVLYDFIRKYKRLSMSKDRISRQEVVDIIAGRTAIFPEDLMSTPKSAYDRFREVLRH